MELKEYQCNALDAFSHWLKVLREAEEEAERLVAALPPNADVGILNQIRNYPRQAWERLVQENRVTDGVYVERTDNAQRPIPHICFKVPTGGGKTLLAAAALQRLHRQTGFTLWIMPTNAIFEQTKKAALHKRDHPYRQILEMASGGRVKLLEKEDPFTRADVEHYLCVMLLMFPAANRQRNKDALRMFRNSGRYPTLFPDSDDRSGNDTLLRDHPDLHRIDDGKSAKHSLFNAIKMLRPVVVLDEAHKAYGRKQEDNEEYARTISGLNPRLVIELSATPNRGISNLLVDITGVELKREEMIKLPVKIEAFTNADWRYTLAQAHAKMECLAAEGESLQSNDGRYIRPIAVVRVERTGSNQRDGIQVHSEDVRDYLIQNLGVSPRAVAVKSSETDELSGIDLLAETSQIRWVITKAALMEGWDCPFAYMLVMLDNTRAQRAITQLVGRVMRQPHARRTGRQVLDQCYAYCWNSDIGKAVAQVKQGLEKEGLGRLGIAAISAKNLRPVILHRRKEFWNKPIYLPLVLHKNGSEWCELDYQSHILSDINWDVISAPDPQQSLPDETSWMSATVDVDNALTDIHATKFHIDKTVQIDWFARRLSDVVPNPWQVARIARDLVTNLRADGYADAEIYDRRKYLAFALQQHVTDKVKQQAEQVFRRKLAQGTIRFDLEAGQPNFRMVDRYEIEIPEDNADLMARKDGEPMQLNLFKSVYGHQFSGLERNFAQYLDERKALEWWHRVAVKQGDYYLQGWNNGRIWPDFVAMAQDNHVLVFETKGEHLDNPDTDYKRRVLETLQEAFNCGKMEVRVGSAKGTFRLVFSEAEFPAALSTLDTINTSETG